MFCTRAVGWGPPKNERKRTPSEYQRGSSFVPDTMAVLTQAPAYSAALVILAAAMTAAPAASGATKRAANAKHEPNTIHGQKVPKQHPQQPSFQQINAEDSESHLSR